MVSDRTSTFFPSLLAGARSLLGFAVSGMLFGILFGIASASAGLTIFQATLMSATMFSAAGQFAALEFWQTPLPYATLAISTLLVSSRLILLSLAMVPYITTRALATRLAGFSLLLDPNAVMIMNLKRPHDPLGFMMGGGLSMYILWIAGTIIGATFTNILTTDMVAALQYAGVLFIALVMMTVAKGNSRHWLPWMISGTMAAGLTFANYHPAIIMIGSVLAGTIAGILKVRLSRG